MKENSKEGEDVEKKKRVKKRGYRSKMERRKERQGKGEEEGGK